MIVECHLTGCKHNSACCTNSHKGKTTYCTLERIKLTIDNTVSHMDCKQYEYDYKKPYECQSCKEKEKKAKIAVIEKTIKLFKQEIAKEKFDYSKALNYINKVAKQDSSMAQMMKEELYKRL